MNRNINRICINCKLLYCPTRLNILLCLECGVQYKYFILLLMSLKPLQSVSIHSIYVGQNLKQTQLLAKKRIKDQYIPKYRKKLNMSRTKIQEPSTDRLSQLTIKQIDRLVQIEKIQCLLKDEKKGMPSIHICSLEQQKNRHPNVFQGRFLAKINKIALKRNIKHVRSQQFDENVMTPTERRKRGLMMQKRNLKFVKNYRVDQEFLNQKQYDDSEEKSIDSIDESVSEFQNNLEERRKCNTVEKETILNKYRYKRSNILSATRWFNGMSTYYVDLDQTLFNQGSNAIKNFAQSRKKQSLSNTKDAYEKDSLSGYITKSRSTAKNNTFDTNYEPQERRFSNIVKDRSRQKTCAY